ncbi:hypothetical protein SUDANB180_06185 [Streptomyces sp. enrichment culture]
MAVMRGEQKHRTRTSEFVCGSCKQPVGTVVERHKSFGIFIPVWTAGPCHNPRCPEYVSEAELIGRLRGARDRRAGRIRH